MLLEATLLLLVAQPNLSTQVGVGADLQATLLVVVVLAEL
jgi:hypothetical protein